MAEKKKSTEATVRNISQKSRKEVFSGRKDQDRIGWAKW